VKLVEAVDPDRPSLERTRDPHRTADVVGEDAGRKAVLRFIGRLDDLLFGVEGGEDDDGAEDLLLNDLHIGSDVTEDGLSG